MAHRDDFREDQDSHEPLYMISVAARLCDVHPQTLRLYERVGLVKPRRVGRKNRMYSDADIERLRRIQRLTQDLGVNLAGVEVIFGLLEQMENMRKQMEEEIDRMRIEMENEIRHIQRTRRRDRQ